MGSPGGSAGGLTGRQVWRRSPYGLAPGQWNLAILPGRLFEGRRQLIVYHCTFQPERDAGCPSCTAGTSELSTGLLEHLHTRDTSHALVPQAPLDKLERWKAKQGWDIPWYSSGDGDLTDDFGVTIDASRGFDQCNLRTLDEYAAVPFTPTRRAPRPGRPSPGGTRQGPASFAPCASD